MYVGRVVKKQRDKMKQYKEKETQSKGKRSVPVLPSRCEARRVLEAMAAATRALRRL